MFLSEKIAQNKEEFRRICNQYDIQSLYAFGSATNSKFDFEKSDVDLIVDLNEKDPIIKGEKLLSIWNAFELFFKRKVDLLTTTSIKNPFLKKSIEQTKVLVYDGSKREILI